MRGDEWGRLVSAPSASDIDAALADVKLRAVPIARRNARKRWALSALSALVLLGGVFWAGGLVAGNGVQVGGSSLNGFRGGYPGAPELVLAPGEARSERHATQTYRVTSWSELDGLRFAEGESWVTGPTGVGFVLSFWQPSLQSMVRINVSADSLEYLVASFMRGHYGLSPRKLDLYEEGHAYGRLVIARGRDLLLYPLGRHTGDEPTEVVRISGPDLDPPAAARFDSNPRWPGQNVYFSSEERAVAFDLPERLRVAAASGIRVATTRASDVGVRGLFYAAVPTVRFSVVGGSGFADLLYGGNVLHPILAIPGIADSLVGSATWLLPPDGGSAELCFGLRLRSQSRDPSTLAAGCIQDTAIAVKATNGLTIRAQIVGPVVTH
ncbi:MAG TPA: hypothetical protein VGI92_04260 [Gemmatimonadales bacterium]|jgi:hypothetical protein